MSPDDLAGHAALLDRWFAAFNKHDLDALCELADGDLEMVPLGEAESDPPGTSYHGHNGLRTLMSATFERFPRMRVDYSPPRPDGAQVTVDLDFVLDDGVTPPTVRSVGCKYRIADGRIRRIRAFEHADGSQPRSRAEGLSPREREILALLASGKTVAEIADELYLSPFTVRTHVRNAKDKLQARTTAHAIAIALDEDVIDV